MEKKQRWCVPFHVQTFSFSSNILFHFIIFDTIAKYNINETNIVKLWRWREETGKYMVVGLVVGWIVVKHVKNTSRKKISE